MSRIAIIGYMTGSESVSILRDTLNERFQTNPARILRQQGSQFRGRASDLIINWGSGRDIADDILGQANILNKPTAINSASNKITALNTMSAAGVSTVEYTTEFDTANQWVEDGSHVFCRTELRGHSGEGIVCVAQSEPEALGNVEFTDALPIAPLYTKGVTGLHREFRVHVFKGKIIFLQQKRRAAGYRENPDYSNVVRNHGNGWIYAHNNMTTPNNKCLINAVKAVEALGLDFGAVDVLTHQDDAWVLEVNTAPGQTGITTREKYVNALVEVYEGREVTALMDTPTETTSVGTPEAIIQAASTVVGVEPQEVVAEIVTPTPQPAQPTTREVVIQPTNVSQVNVGDKVRIRTTSSFYVGTNDNPRDVLGEVIGVVASDMYPIKVSWPECPRNCYRVVDIEIVREETVPVQQPAVAPAPAAPQPSTQAPSVPASSVVNPTDGNFYRAVVDNTQIVVQYSADIDSFFMCGFDLPLSKDQVDLISKIDF